MASDLSDDVDLVCRLACFGSEDGTFHVLNRKNQPHQADFLTSRFAKDRGHEVVKRLKKIATQKRYARKENMLFSLAATIYALGVDCDEHSTDDASQQAYQVVESLCDGPADLFTFISYEKELRTTSKASWSRGMRTLVANFYSRKSPETLAHQITRCKSGHGFTHRDVMSLIHMPCDKLSSGGRLVLKYAFIGNKALEVKAEEEESSSEGVDKALAVLNSVERLRKIPDSEKETIRSLIETHKLMEKQIPSNLFRMREVFEGLLGHMPLTTLVRKIPKMAELGLLNLKSLEADKVIDRLKDTSAFEEERISPVTVFVSQRKYDMNRSKKWIRNPQLVQAMKEAYELSLRNMPITNKRYLLACHIEDKTISKTCVTGTSCMSPIMPCVILAQTLARRETNPQFVYFRRNCVTELSLSKNIAAVAVLEQILKHTKEPANDDYDLCDPLKWAAEKKKAYDCIVIVAGKKKVSSQTDLKAAISHYRAESGVSDARVAIVGLQGPISFPDRDDMNFLDVTGFDEDVMVLLQTFCHGLPTDEDMDADDDDRK